uniref:CHK kinase-like domain-containing protein n=2 Tax=Photinus pyralis TaxID=7054 RepID=A0A1Y1KWL5_PHOPY
MREMGRFHALSYAIREQKPEIFDSWEDQCHEYFFSSNFQGPLLKGMTRLISDVLNSYSPHQNEKEQRALEEFARDSSIIYKSGLVISSDDKKYAVEAHGDMELRNLLLKYGRSDDPEHPTELCILDWQLMRVASPALDVLFFLFLSSDGELRKQYYTKLIDEYYDSLSSFLRELGSDPEVLLPFPILLEHLRKLSGFVLLIAIWLLATNMKESDDVPDFSNIDSEDALVTMISVVPKRGYLQRIRELVSDMIEFDYPFSKLVDQ